MRFLALAPLLIGCSPVASECASPETVGTDPVIVDDTLDVNRFRVLGGAGFLVHLIDLATDPTAERLYGGGSGGLWVFDVDEAGVATYRGSWNDQASDTFSRVAVLPGDHVAVLDRSTGDLSASPEIQRFNGVRILDVGQPRRIRLVGEVELADVSFLAAAGNLLYLLRHQGLLEVYDLADPTAPQRLSQLSGLGNPRSLTLPDEAGLVLIADGELGLVRADLSDPTDPTLIDHQPVAGTVMDLTRTAEQVYVAVGSAGVETFELTADPPRSLGAVPLTGTATQVAVADGLVWVAGLDGFSVLRQQRGAPPLPHAFEPTERFSLCVAPVPGRQGAVHGCDWSELLLLQADRAARAPQAVLDADVLRMPEGTQEIAVRLSNRGSVDLHVAELRSATAGVSGTPPAQPVAPGTTGTFTLHFDGGFTPDAAVCLASDDPGRPIQELRLATGDEVADQGVGAVASDFSLPDLEGTLHSLSDYAGRPVLLVWFATW